MIISTEDHVENVEVSLSLHLVNHARLKNTNKQRKEKKKKEKNIRRLFNSGPMDMVPTFSKRSNHLRERAREGRIVENVG